MYRILLTQPSNASFKEPGCSVRRIRRHHIPPSQQLRKQVTWEAIDLAVLLLSPVIRTTSKPMDFRMWTASSASGFTVSAMASKLHSWSNTGASEVRKQRRQTTLISNSRGKWMSLYKTVSGPHKLLYQNSCEKPLHLIMQALQSAAGVTNGGSNRKMNRVYWIPL